MSIHYTQMSPRKRKKKNSNRKHGETKNNYQDTFQQSTTKIITRKSPSSMYHFVS